MKTSWFIKSISVLLAVWYLFTIVGFDIHRCSDNGEVYIEPLFAGISCETIHPDTPCHHACNARCNHCGCEEGEDCCSDEIKVVNISGIEIPHISIPEIIVVTAATPQYSCQGLQNRPVLLSHRGKPDILSPPGQLLDRICVLRV